MHKDKEKENQFILYFYNKSIFSPFLVPNFGTPKKEGVSRLGGRLFSSCTLKCKHLLRVYYVVSILGKLRGSRNFFYSLCSIVMRH